RPRPGRPARSARPPTCRSASRPRARIRPAPLPPAATPPATPSPCPARRCRG
ncbi:MAG: hypothetical protein AVDCRST_MAG11-3348, partial [uncultured Gemmatimonadaceae bacterium]